MIFLVKNQLKILKNKRIKMKITSIILQILILDPKVYKKRLNLI
jgi:hypothetical protein